MTCDVFGGTLNFALSIYLSDLVSGSRSIPPFCPTGEACFCDVSYIPCTLFACRNDSLWVWCS